MENIKIIGCGYAAPERSISNDELSKYIDTSDEWISSRTGIRSRYVSPKENTSQLAIRAAQNAIETSGIDKERISLIVVATLTPDAYTPSCACMVQAGLGLNDHNVMAFDINAACSGFLFALKSACRLLDEGVALVIGAETLSKILDWKDRNTCVLFGDGAGACLIEKSSTDTMNFYCRSKGDTEHTLFCPGRALQPDIQNVPENKQYLEMNGREVFRFAIQAMPDAILHVLNGQDLDAVDYIIPHQANVRILNHVSQKMKIPMEKMFINLDEFGNTSAASVPIALAQAWQKGKIRPGMDVILVGFGAGFTWGACKIHIEGGNNDDDQ